MEPHDGARWRLPLGANVVDGGVEFRVRAPEREQVDVEIGREFTPLLRGEDGVWSGVVAGAGPGSRYRFRLDGDGWFPDPYSRSQPDGPHGASEVVDPGAFAWHDQSWRGLVIEGLVIYECHVGTYTAAGTFDGLIEELGALRELGINALELMPVAEFPGTRNWGYDGVDLFAPTRNYGGPEALRRLVDAAHEHGIGVMLDVVYNHFGPDGNYLLQYSPAYLTRTHMTPWGDAVNYDSAGCQLARRLVIDNACYWLNEYHIDGLRLDGTFAIVDSSPRHIIAEMSDAARASVPAQRGVVLIAETYENDARYVRPAKQGGLGMDAVWADDFHHVVHTAASHEHSGYYEDYTGTMGELARTINRGWLFEGQPSKHLGGHRGTLSDGLPAPAFVYFIQNHDQVGNRAFGRRYSHLVGATNHKFWSAMLLLLPYTPMLFMGQEFAASSRFYYFTDHGDDLALSITEGRRQEFAAFADYGSAKGLLEIPDPQAAQTFADSKLHLTERRDGAGEQIYRLHRELIALRREDAVLRRQDRESMQAVAITDELLLVRMWHDGDERLIVANSGVAIDAQPEAAGIPADLAGRTWRVLISTDERRFGGGADSVRFDSGLISLPPYTVVLLAAERAAVQRGPFGLRALFDAIRRRLPIGKRDQAQGSTR